MGTGVGGLCFLILFYYKRFLCSLCLFVFLDLDLDLVRRAGRTVLCALCVFCICRPKRRQWTSQRRRCTDAGRESLIYQSQ